MSVVIRCPACLTLLPNGARRCAACGLQFEPGLQRRWPGIVLAAACALAAAAGAWWLRGREPPADPASDGASRSTAPAPASEPQPDPSSSRFDGRERPPGSVPIAPSAGDAAPIDAAALAQLAASLLRIETRDGAGRALRSVSAFRVDAASADVLLPFRALNGAALLARGATARSGEASASEVAAIDGEELARVAGLAPQEAPAVALAPAASIGVGGSLYALQDDRDPSGPAALPFAAAGTIVRIDARAGVVEFAAAIPCDQRWVADASGRMVGLASTDADGVGRVVVVEAALEHMLTSRPARLEQIDATWFDRVGAARRERATWYAAGQHYAVALSNYLVAIDLDPPLREEIAAPATACAQLALRDARLRDVVGELLPLLERAAELLDREPFVLYACGLALLDQGEPERALAYLQDAASIGGAQRGELVDALRAGYQHAGEAARADGRPIDAITILEEGLQRFREDLLLLKSLGFAYYETGDRERARIIFEKVASLDDGEARVLAPLLAALAPAPAPASDATAVEIRFDRSEGAIRTRARFSDRADASVIIDTGATITAISEGLADRLKIDRGRAVRRAQITTASGRLEVPVVLLDSIDVQGARVTNVEAVVIPLQEDGGGEALIGLNFLEHFSLSLDARRGVLRLAPKR